MEMGIAHRLLPCLLLAGCVSASQDVHVLVAELGDADVAVRDRATANLRRLLPEAAEVLARHVDDSDSEVAARCRALLHESYDDWTWYQVSGLSGIELQLVEAYVWWREYGCGNAKLESKILEERVRSLYLHPAACLPLMRAKDPACPDHSLPLFRITADAACHERVVNHLERGVGRETESMFAALLTVAQATETDFILTRDGDLRFSSRKNLFERLWTTAHHDALRPELAGNYRVDLKDGTVTDWANFSRAAVLAWELPR